MLFATLDPTMRAVELPNNGPEVILSDTVGFISDLPTQLVAAFRATLEEVLAADLVLHVRDIAHPETEHQAEDVRTILETLGLNEETPQIEVWNKIDLLSADDRDAMVAKAEREEDIFAVSAVSGQGLDEMFAAIQQALASEKSRETLKLSFAAGKARAWLFKEGIVEEEAQTDEGFEITVLWSAKQRAQFESL